MDGAFQSVGMATISMKLVAIQDLVPRVILDALILQALGALRIPGVVWKSHVQRTCLRAGIVKDVVPVLFPKEDVV